MMILDIKKISIIVMIVLLSGCTSSENNTSSSTTSTSSQVDDENQEAVDEESEEAEEAEPSSQEDSDSDDDLQDYIDFTLNNQDGEAVSISDYEGKFIMLNFFATWCSPCMEEIPDLEAFYSSYEGDDFQLLLVNLTTSETKSEEEVIDWYESEGLSMPMLLDDQGIASSTYPTTAIPTSIFINKEGKILGKVQGGMTKDMLQEVLDTYNN